MTFELLTNEQMGLADAYAINSGIPGLTLMENAGRAVADEVKTVVKPGAAIVIMCGPGNNGGDGFVAARRLQDDGYKVKVALSCPLQALTADAAEMARKWTGPIEEFIPATLAGADAIIDAVFGAGLTRPIEQNWHGAPVLASMNGAACPVLSVDVPSGLNGSTGEAAGMVVRATKTVTFFRKKPAHLLYPGAALCGEIKLAQIGIPTQALAEIAGPDDGPINTFINTPEFWRAAFPKFDVTGHKYDRGHSVVVSGPAHATGAARLAARGALRVGAGLVTVASPSEAVAANASHLTAIMIAPFVTPSDLRNILADKRKNSVVAGPGCGVGERTREIVTHVLAAGMMTVLDADALTSFENHRDALRILVQAVSDRPVVMTPHEGELARIIPPAELQSLPSKLHRARWAARAYGATVVLKGPDTVVANPDGKASINNNAPPWLATAGSGDVLAGMIAGLMSQGMFPFEASSAAVWLHGACAQRFGRGLIAEDIPEILPDVLQNLEAAR